MQAALARKGKLVITGPEILARQPLILFSSEDGDAWLLDPSDGFAMCLAWHDERHEPAIRDTGRQLEIQWNGAFSLIGHSFEVESEIPSIGQRAIFGYPIDELKQAIDKAASIEKKMNDLFINRDTVPITDELIATLETKGWDRVRLEEGRVAGARNSFKRDSLLFPMQFE